MFSIAHAMFCDSSGVRSLLTLPQRFVNIGCINGLFLTHIGFSPKISLGEKLYQLTNGFRAINWRSRLKFYQFPGSQFLSAPDEFAYCVRQRIGSAQCGRFTQPETGKKTLIQSHFELLTEEKLVYFQNF